MLYGFLRQFAAHSERPKGFLRQFAAVMEGLREFLRQFAALFERLLRHFAAYYIIDSESVCIQTCHHKGLMCHADQPSGRGDNRRYSAVHCPTDRLRG
jgi:hypothetical protein